MIASQSQSFLGTPSRQVKIEPDFDVKDQENGDTLSLPSYALALEIEKQSGSISIHLLENPDDDMELQLAESTNINIEEPYNEPSTWSPPPDYKTQTEYLQAKLNEEILLTISSNLWKLSRHLK